MIIYKEKKVENKISRILQNLNLKENAPVKLKFSDGTQVFHYTDDYLDEALDETGVLSELSHVICYDGIRKSNSVLNQMRNNGVLDDYERGSFTFDDYVYDLLKEDWQDYVEENLDQWDFKRGMCNLSTEVEVPLNLLAEAENFGFTLGAAWEVFVRTDAGELRVEF